MLTLHRIMFGLGAATQANIAATSTTATNSDAAIVSNTATSNSEPAGAQLLVSHNQESIAQQSMPQQLPSMSTPGRSRHKVLLGASGSVAAIKVVELAYLLAEFAEVKLVLTKAARHFIQQDGLPFIIHGDEEEWHEWEKKGDPVLHIELRKWADLLVVAPLSANTLAKLAQGLCDNCLTSVVRAWDWSKPLLVAPAMNTHMWDSLFTSQHIAILEQQLGVDVIPPVSKALACGDVGTGAMAEPSSIAQAVQSSLTAQHKRDL